MRTIMLRMTGTLGKHAAFGEALRNIRFTRNLTQQNVEELTLEVAARQGNSDFIVRNSQLSAYEHGRALPGPGKLVSLAAVYDLTRDDLMSLWVKVNRDSAGEA